MSYWDKENCPYLEHSLNTPKTIKCSSCGEEIHPKSWKQTRCSSREDHVEWCVANREIEEMSEKDYLKLIGLTKKEYLKATGR